LDILDTPGLLLRTARKIIRKSLRNLRALLLLLLLGILLGFIQTMGAFVAQTLAHRANPWTVGPKMVTDPTTITSANIFKRNGFGRDKR
jgi:hypothetical protein